MLRRFIHRLLSSSKNGPIVDFPDWPDEWSIGIYIGESPFKLLPSENVANPVLNRENVSDVLAAFVADPFMLHVNHMWYMFFEVMNRTSRKGEIGLATSKDALTWTYQRIVLAEPYHLSYPYVFEWMNEYYMIPETYMAGSVRLYKAIEFPTKWSFAGTLLAGPYYADPSILHYENKWWLFADASGDLKHDTLRLFWTENLTGLWFEHPLSPIVAGNPHVARPAGRILVLYHRPVRFAQDCYPTYGTQIRAFEITELTTTSYREREMAEGPVLTASGVGWNKSGMHQIDPHLLENGQWIACVDGFFWKEVRE